MCAYKIHLPVESEDLMTVAQAADELGIHLATAYRWVEKGQLRTCRIGDQVFVYVDEVRIIKEQKANE